MDGKVVDLKKECFNVNGRIQSPVTLKENQWLIIYPENCKREMNELIDTLMDNSKRYGIKVEEPLTVKMGQKDKFEEWKKELEIEIKELKKESD
jgi:hypoxanthine phosphoribosyltransferase